MARVVFTAVADADSAGIPYTDDDEMVTVLRLVDGRRALSGKLVPP